MRELDGMSVGAPNFSSDIEESVECLIAISRGYVCEEVLGGMTEKGVVVRDYDWVEDR
jgi:hypothetical protein